MQNRKPTRTITAKRTIARERESVRASKQKLIHNKRTNECQETGERKRANAIASAAATAAVATVAVCEEVLCTVPCLC